MPFSRQWDLCNPPNPIPPGHHGPLLARAKQYVPKETDENKISQGVNQILGDNSCIGNELTN